MRLVALLPSAILVGSAAAFAPSSTAVRLKTATRWAAEPADISIPSATLPRTTRVVSILTDRSATSSSDKPASALAHADETPADESPNGDRLQGGLLMLAVAMLWGSNFPAVKAIQEAGLPGSAAAAARFSVAAVALLPLLGQSEDGPPRDLVLGGLECGAWLAVGYIAQALALHDLPAGAVAFLASLQVVFVPLLLTCLGGKFTARLALAATLCISGVGLLEAGGMSGGDVTTGAVTAMPLGATCLALLQPVGFGTSARHLPSPPSAVPARALLPAYATSRPHVGVVTCVGYLRIEALMKRFPSYGLQLSSLQLLSNAAIALAWCAADALLLSEPGSYDLSALTQQPAVIGGIFYTGLISTALTVLLQTRALSMLPATDSSVIVATEPLWAAGFGMVLLGEVLEPSAQLGGLCILLGCVANTVLPDDLGKSSSEDEPGA